MIITMGRKDRYGGKLEKDDICMVCKVKRSEQSIVEPWYNLNMIKQEGMVCSDECFQKFKKNRQKFLT